jgi:hypothetical protein
MADSWSQGVNVTGTPTNTIGTSSIYGNYQRIQYTGVTGDSGKYIQLISSNTVNGSFVAGDSVTVSIYLKGTFQYGGGTKYLTVSAYDSSGNDLGDQSIVLNSSYATWTRVQVTNSSLPTNTSKVGFQVYVSGVNSSSNVDMSYSAAQIEKGAFATSYIPTIASAVARAEDIVSIPTTNWSAAAGTVFGVASVPSAPMISGRVMDWYQNASNEIQIWSSTTGDIQGQTLSASTTSSEKYDAQTGYHSTSMVYSNNTQTLFYLDGSESGTKTVANYTTISPSATAGIGNRITGSRGYDFPIQRLTVYNSALSSGNVSTVTSAVQNGP